MGGDGHKESTVRASPQPAIATSNGLRKISCRTSQWDRFFSTGTRTLRVLEYSRPQARELPQATGFTVTVAGTENPHTRTPYYAGAI